MQDKYKNLPHTRTCEIGVGRVRVCKKWGRGIETEIQRDRGTELNNTYILSYILTYIYTYGQKRHLYRDISEKSQNTPKYPHNTPRSISANTV